MSILSVIGSIVKPVTDLIDNLHTSEEEKGQIRVAMEKMSHDVTMLSLKAEMDTLKAQASIVRAEAQGASWMQRNWRPLTMLVFLAMIVYSYMAPVFGLIVVTLPPDLWALIKIGLGGYVVGRSAEKAVKEHSNARIKVAETSAG